MDTPSVRDDRAARCERADAVVGETRDPRFFASTIGWLFHTLLALPVVLLLWSFSAPGVALFSAALALLGLAAFGAVWLVRLIVCAARGGRRYWSFVLTPAIAVLVFALCALDVPLDVRWALSRPAFDRVAAQLASNREATTPERIGLYSVGQPQRVPGGWIVYEDGGSGFIDDAGFAYLPAGPTPELEDGAWENPQFHHLGGPWYSWTASW